MSPQHPPSSNVQNLLRSVVPRSARNWLRSPSTSARWLWDEVRFSCGIKDVIEIRPDWSVACHPAAYRCAYFAQRWDPEQVVEFDGFIDNATPGMVLLDVGAHFGLFSLAALHYGGPGARAVAIDPSPTAVSLLKIQAKLNNVESRLRIIQAAVSDHVGMQSMVSAGVLASGYYVAPNGNSSSRELSQTASVTLDSLCDELKLKPTHIKIDVEGLEAGVLRGAIKTLSQQPAPLLFMELHNEIVQGLGLNAEETLELLEHSGYNVFSSTGESMTRESILSEPLIRVIARKSE